MIAEAVRPLCHPTALLLLCHLRTDFTTGAARLIFVFPYNPFGNQSMNITIVCIFYPCKEKKLT